MSGDRYSTSSLPTDRPSLIEVDLLNLTRPILGPPVIGIRYSEGASIFAAVCCILFIIVGVIGNLMTALALSRYVKLRNATTAFVISLSIADFIFCAVNLPLTASRYIHQQWLLGNTMCVLFPFIFYGNVAVSLLSMVAITVNRYVLIAHYYIYDRIYTKLNIVLMILFCWGFSFVCLIPTLAGSWGHFGYDKQTFSCTILEGPEGESPKKFLFIVGFFIPCIVIIVCYSCIFYKVRQSRRNVMANTPTTPVPDSQRQKQHRDDLRLTRLMLLIFCSFVICFLPLMIVNVSDDKITYPLLHVLSSILAWMSAVINPVIYALMNRQYRHAYVRLLCGKRFPFLSITDRNRNGSNRSKGSTVSGHSKTLVTDVFVFDARANRLKPPKLGTVVD